MKKIAILCLIVLGVACKKNEVDTGTQSLGKRLVSLTANNKPQYTFVYKNNLLTKENYFGFCETNPTDEYSYEYKGNLLYKITMKSRSLYSSTLALCNPEMGVLSEEIFEYDKTGKLVKISRLNDVVTEFVYDTKGRVEKQLIKNGQNTSVTTFEYDARDNIVQLNNPDGSVVIYEYDNHPNPYYYMNQRPGWISAFNKSPNNVIKATGGSNFTRVFTYAVDGFPEKVLENNGISYTYNYE